VLHTEEREIDVREKEKKRLMVILEGSDSLSRKVRRSLNRQNEV
jgi:hypothetical protein